MASELQNNLELGSGPGPWGNSELWKSDGTVAGTLQLRALPAQAFELTDVNGTLFFVAADGLGNWGIWKSDGTVAGTAQLTSFADEGFGRRDRRGRE